MEAQIKGMWHFLQGRTFALLLIPALVLLIGHGGESRSSYCRVCGKLRSESTRKFFGLQYQRHDVMRDTEFSKIYSSRVNPHQQHNWRRWSRFWFQGYHGFLGAGVGCGKFPSFLNGAADEYNQVKPLKYLNDRKKVAVVLRTLQEKDGTQSSDYDILQAVGELNKSSSASQQNQWWQRHRNLFAKTAKEKS